MSHDARKVGLLLFGSGACALMYQTVWLRQFRLVFGASTSATAAVLAIFMGGLGIGSAVLGRRADRAANPLLFYSNLELMIATAAALSQPLLLAVRAIYIAVGGSVVLGSFGATIVRLLLSLVVLGIPTFLMGGTLPAAARAVEDASDEGRNRVALLYGFNTIGAVAGTILSTFWALELFGNRKTLFIAALINALVAMTARGFARRETSTVVPAPAGERRTRELPRQFVFLAAGIVGFAFLLMELVWYRMLAPLLGGTTFTFGLILAFALLGIGCGGAIYSQRPERTRATAGGFALTCSFEAVAMIAPFALGDRLAVIATDLQPLGNFGFPGHVLSWSLVTFAVVFPAALISGIQFPLLITLLGSGEEEVGSDIGSAYAWNTIGAIVGSLAGGFGLMPMLSAPGCWRAATILLGALAVASLVFSIRSGQRTAPLFAAFGVVLAIAGGMSRGPGAVWRHSGIGVGRGEHPSGPLDVKVWIQDRRRQLLWDADGRESGIGFVASEDAAFIVNGKSDGAARGDAETQVMGGLVPAILHGAPRTALVIGLGTGSTAGWLGEVPTMRHVEAVELEPVVLRVARDCAPVNRDVLHNPRVHVRIADAREVLLTTPERYDVIFSEPSNPYRAGIASLFTKEFYDSAAQRLQRGGVFAQWVQTYDVDAQTVGSVYATMRSVFPYVETWRLAAPDLLLIGSMEPIRHDFDAIRARIAAEPYRSALFDAWRVDSLEGFLAHAVATPEFATAVAAQAEDINTDDRTPIEFGFARSVIMANPFGVRDVVKAADIRGQAVPRPVRGTADLRRVLLLRATSAELDADPPPAVAAEYRLRHQFAQSYATSAATALPIWQQGRWSPDGPFELAAVAEALAEAGRPEAEPLIAAVRARQPIEADAVEALLRLRQKRLPEAAALFERALLAYRTDPWPLPELMGRAVQNAAQLAHLDRRFAPQVLHAYEKPYAVWQWNEERRMKRVQVAYEAERCGATTLAALHDLEPSVPWTRNILVARSDCYRATHDYRAAKAVRDLAEFDAATPAPLVR